MQLLAQDDESAPEAGLDGAEGQAGLRGDLRVGEAVFEKQIKKFPGILREIRERGLHRLGIEVIQSNFPRIVTD